MADTPQNLRSELERSTALLRKLRDEVRVQLHLGGLDVKDEWLKLEPRLEAALERAAHEVSDASRSAIHEVLLSLRKLRDRHH
jgi:hypothetical protein